MQYACNFYCYQNSEYYWFQKVKLFEWNDFLRLHHLARFSSRTLLFPIRFAIKYAVLKIIQALPTAHNMLRNCSLVFKYFVQSNFKEIT